MSIAASLDWRNGAHPGDDSVDVVVGHLAEIDLARHRQLERAAVAADALRQRALDLRVAPRADARRLVRRDVAGNDLSERTLEYVSALAVPVDVVLRAVRPPRMAFHAVGDGGEIETALDGVTQRLLGDRLLAVGNELGVHFSFVDRWRDLIANRRYRLGVSGDCIEIAWGEDLVEGKRHLRRKRYPVRPHAFRERALDVGFAPAADPGLWIGRDVSPSHRVGLLVPDLRATREPLAQIEHATRARRVAAVTAHDRVDEIAAAVHQRLGRRGDSERGDCRRAQGKELEHDPSKSPTNNQRCGAAILKGPSCGQPGFPNHEWVVR